MSDIEWVMVPRVATREMLNDGSGALNEPVWMEEMAKAWDAMIEIAPHPPVSLGEISQAQARAMREALEEAIELVDQDDNCLTPAGDALVARWRAALSASPLPAP